MELESVEKSVKTLAQGFGVGGVEMGNSGSELRKEVCRSSGLVGGSEENGIRVCINGDDVVVGTEAGEKVETDGLVQRNITVDGVGDSELSGACSLLKMRGSLGEVEGGVKSLQGLDSVLVDAKNEEVAGSVGGVKVVAEIGDVKVVKESNIGEENVCKKDGDVMIENGENSVEEFEEMGENEFEVAEDMDGEVCKFSVGDFVWGKIKTHPWWPGRIYDPSDSSESAAKFKQKDRFLVAFGDGTFAWCRPSQLKPFEENFEEMSKQSTVKSFVSAVQGTVNEISRLAEVEMTCSCVAEEYGVKLSRQLAVNTGIREGVFVPEGGGGTLSVSRFEPVELIASLKYLAQVVTATNVLELVVLKNQLSAFYRAKGGYQLPVFQELHPIPGLEDKNTEGVNSHRDAVEVPIQGPFNEDRISSPLGPDSGLSCRPVLQRCPGNSEDQLYQRRKQKSMAEIMGRDAVLEPKDNSGKLSGRKKRKVTDKVNSNGGDASASLSKRVKWTEVAESLTTTENKLSTVDNGRDKEETKKGRRKKKEGFSIENDGLAKNRTINVTTVQSDGGEVEEKSEKGSVSTERKEDDSSNENDDGSVSTKRKMNTNSSVQSDDGDAKDHFEKGSVLRERKKSKYLSPPYITTTSLNRAQRSRESEKESPKIDTVGQIGEPATADAEHLFLPPPIVKCNDETFEKKLSKELCVVELEDSSIPQTPTQDENLIIDQTKVNVPANELLSEVRSVARAPGHRRENEYIDMDGGLLSVFRSSVYRNGSNYKIYKKQLSGRKRKSLEAGSVSVGRDPNQTDHESAETKSHHRKIEKKEETKMDKPKLNQTAKAPSAKKNDDESKDSSVALFVTFGPGSSLPTKNDLIKIYGKFGDLNERETDMFYNNFCARVAFVNSSDAEEAFNCSQEVSPFGNDKVSFRLRYPAAVAKIRELSEISDPNAASKTSGKSSASQPSTVDASQLDFIKQKLEMMTSMLEKSDGKMSPQMKSKLEGEMKGLLEKVSSMAGSSSS